LPAGFNAVTQYANPVRSYTFGDTLPQDWVASNGSYGYEATVYVPQQVAGGVLTAVKGGSLGYESGWITTEGAFTLSHGRVDFTVTIPEGQGLWPACWLVATGQGEIDVMENLAGSPSVIYSTLHAANGLGWTQQGTRAVGGSNVFTVVWEPGQVTMASDYGVYAQFTPTTFTGNTGQPWPFDSSSLYLIVNLGVGGPNSWGGQPSSTTIFPAVMTVESVKVYQ
jgi:beta-glucanase (GH16 family)